MVRDAGFSMLEILVSLVVLSIGLLGLAALQTTAMRFNHDGHLLSIAVSQANMMADRMRANKAGVTAGDYNTLSGIPTPPACTTCSPAQRAQKDLYDWNTRNAAALPSGQGTVTAAGGLFSITVRWDNERTGVTGTGCSGDSSVDLACVTVSLQL